MFFAGSGPKSIQKIGSCSFNSQKVQICCLFTTITQTISSIIPIPLLWAVASQKWLQRLKPSTKNKRAIEALGTAWKLLAGTPDPYDHEVIINKLNDQLENNNKQVE